MHLKYMYMYMYCRLILKNQWHRIGLLSSTVLTLTLMKVSLLIFVSKYLHFFFLIIFILFTEKHTFDGLTDLMTKVAATELAGLDPEVKECHVIYVPQVNAILYIHLYVH